MTVITGQPNLLLVASAFVFYLFYHAVLPLVLFVVPLNFVNYTMLTEGMGRYTNRYKQL